MYTSNLEHLLFKLKICWKFKYKDEDLQQPLSAKNNSLNECLHNHKSRIDLYNKIDLYTSMYDKCLGYRFPNINMLSKVDVQIRVLVYFENLILKQNLDSDLYLSNDFVRLKFKFDGIKSEEILA